MQRKKVENISIYRRTNDSSQSEEERKKFNIHFHTSEPLGIEVLKATTISVLISGDNLEGFAQFALHDTNNLRNIKEIPVGTPVEVEIPRKGQLFLDVNNIKSIAPIDKVNYTFDVMITLEESSYMYTPTFDIRDSKISANIIENPETFVSEVKKPENSDNGMLMIGHNVRLYFPQSKYVPKNFDPEHVLSLHEDAIKQDNAFAGLDENDPNPIHHPRRNFVLISARNEQVGYMSAGGQMLDTHLTYTKEYFVPGWGMYHEYGHLYEQRWSFIEIWNNMFSKHMAEQTFGFTWLWEDNRSKFESETIKPFYERYFNGETIEREFHFKDGLYFFITLEEKYGKAFVSTLERHWRENENMPLRADYVAYAMADCYGVNVIPYLELYGLKINDTHAYNHVIDHSTSSLFIVPNHPEFKVYQNHSVPATVKSIYEGSNQILSGIANENSIIEVSIDSVLHTVQADKNGRFELLIPGDITVSTAITFTTKDTGKDVTIPVAIPVKTKLSDNKLHLQGYGDGVKLILGFNPLTKKLSAKSTSQEIQYLFANQEYFAIEYYSTDGTLIKDAIATGEGTADAIQEALDNIPFEFGNYIKIRHREAHRAKLYGNVINSPIDCSTGLKEVDLTTSYFYITPEGLEYSDTLK